MLTAAMATLITGILAAGSNVYQNYQNKKSLLAQQKYNEAQQQKAMNYNSPSNQKRLLQQAGINPITAYGGLSNISKITPIETEQAKVQPYAMDLQGVIQGMAQIIGTLNQDSISNETVRGLKVENAYKEDKILQELENMRADVRYKDSQNFINTENLLIQRKKLELEGLSVESAIKLQQQTISNMLVENELKQQDIAFKKVQTDIANIEKSFARAKNASQINQIQVGIQKTIKEISLLSKSITNQTIKNELEQLSLNLSLKTFDSNVQFIESQSRNEYLKPWFQGADLGLNAISKFFPKK